MLYQALVQISVNFYGSRKILNLDESVSTGSLLLVSTNSLVGALFG